MRGHYALNSKWTNEVWGLAIFNKDPTKFLSCSDDATVRLYSASKRKAIKILRLDIDKNKNPVPRKK